MDIPELVPELSEFLRTRGYDVVPESDGELCTVVARPPALGEAEGLAQPRDGFADVGVPEYGDDRARRHRAVLHGA